MSQRIHVRCRPDLQFVQTTHAHESAFVAKDPVSLQYHRMRPDEYFVLSQLQDVSDLTELRKRYEKRFAPRRVSEPELNRLLFRFYQSGLLISQAAGQADQLLQKRRKHQTDQWKQRFSSLLFIRFPGVDPEPLLRRVYPWVRPLLQPACLALWIGLVVSAGIVMLISASRFAAEFPDMHRWLQLDAVVTLMAVIGLTKVAHELGHALVCKHFGGECHQIGPMLLVFTPALYCDTTDSWMLPNRFARASIGLAGMAVEVILASLAAWIWFLSGPGLVHYVAMNVMLVCGISTVVFNANPLLRYDGYYVLSDLLDIPNLSQQANRWLSSLASNLLLGVRDPQPSMETWRYRTVLAVYAIAAFVYRWTLTLVILWFVAYALRPYGLESLGKTLCAFAAAMMLSTMLRGPLRFLQNPQQRHQIKMHRLWISVVATAALGIAALIPYSSRVTATGRIAPAQEARVFVSTTGDLESLSVRPGDSIEQGQVIATLSNEETKLQQVMASGRFESQQAVVQALKDSSVSNPVAANQLPAAEALLADLIDQKARADQRFEALTIRSDFAGVVLEPPRRVQATDKVRLTGWQGDPTLPENAGCTLEAGTELISIAVGNRWNANLIAQQSDMHRLKIGNRVRLIMNAAPDQWMSGEVVHIARQRWNANEHAERRDDPDAARRTDPRSTSYLVSVVLDQPSIRIVTGATVRAKIDAAPISLAGRCYRWLNGLLRFR
ncbi:HlyD family secretion protein [Crateriforma conspicua]|uniref:HlyD family secretion protein n=2 Tax=Crateriforma conspicua TaxID=2527996 RepID=A0A5C5Y5H9_9PLAN|nr:HlyD family secretion protein [Crateriforma conspicua]